MHAPVLAGVRGELELAQDASDVRLHGLSRHEELVRDPTVGLSLCDQHEDLTLTRRQLSEGVPHSWGCDELGDE